MADDQDNATNYKLWLAQVRISLVDPEKDEAIRSFVISAPDRLEAEHRLRRYLSPGELDGIFKIEEIVDNIARVWDRDNQPLDVTTVSRGSGE
ncbi:MAG: hypothetical protein M3Y33_00135 [Actinomycetota bacterium]|nr:hypothetical protein [Actinomycetota bacterium]